MIDGAYTYLIDQLRQTPGPALWFAEEGCGDYLPMLATFKTLCACTVPGSILLTPPRPLDHERNK